MSRLQRLHDAGVSIWLDDLSRELLDTGEFRRLIRDMAVTGATSNPTIFAAALESSRRYDPQLSRALHSGMEDPRDLFFELVLEDVRRGADALRGVNELSHGRDGFVSFECTPDLADDTAATVEQALEVHERVRVPNLLVKVAATDAGIAAIEELTARGVSVNVTLLFSLRRYEQAVAAYLGGLERRARNGLRIEEVHSVASFFVSRVDAAVDRRLPEGSPLRGHAAIANARMAYARHLEWLRTPRWRALAAAGANPQRPLWASTGTKDPSYSDVLYVEELIVPDVIATLPMRTLLAFADHGEAGGPAGADASGASELVEDLAAAGIDLPEVTGELERAGVQAFRESFRDLLACIESKAERLRAAHGWQANA
jgi:transaldolase